MAFYALLQLESVKQLDYNFYTLIAVYQNTNIYDFFMVFNILSGVYVSLFIFTTIFLLLLQSQYFAEALWIVLLAFISMSGTILFKYTLKVERPLHAIDGLTGYSFPSGHVVLSILLSISAYVLFQKTMNNKILQYGSNIILSLYILLSMASRIIISSHWLSDIVASCLVMILFLSITIVTFEKIKKIPMYKKYITH